MSSCNRNPVLLKLFIGVNITLFIFAVMRMLFMTSDVEQPIRMQNIHPSHARALQSMERESPCNCQNNQHTIDELQSKVHELTNSLDSEQNLRQKNERNGDEKIEKCANAAGAQKSVMPTKLGEDNDTSLELQVPNIVHYIWYSTEAKAFEFHHMLSVLSVHKFIKPDVIYFHTDNPPIGKYWDRTKILPRLQIMKRSPPVEVLGEKVKQPKYYTSHSNVDRVLVLMEYGGIYLDFDFYALRSFDDLRKYVCTVGLESDVKVCGSVVVCSKHSFFLYLWINAYLDDYRIDEWAYNTGQVPYNLAKRYPHLVNVEKRRLNRPNFAELGEIWVKPTWWKWRDNYGFHSWYRLWKDNYGGLYTGKEPDENSIKTLNNTFGEIGRVILFDTPDFVK